jgi:hypothetical protein
MVLETAQMLATAIQRHGGKATYKPTHQKHPSTLFVGDTRANYRWTLRHFSALCREYTRRYGKRHNCEDYLKEFIEGAKVIPEGKLTAFPNCAANQSKGISYKHVEDVHEAYKMYLCDRWQTDAREPVWS